MYTETIRLNKSCEICGNISYGEDGSGFYVCQTCGTISDIRCGAELEYEGKTGFMKMKSKKTRSNGIEAEDDFEVKSIDNDSDKDTNVFTANNTRNNSEVNDFSNASVWGRRRKSHKVLPPQRTLKETLLDSQRVFKKLLTLVLPRHSQGKTEAELIEYAKTIWFNYINNEYDLQAKQEGLFGKCRKTNVKYVRSRSNTIEDANNPPPKYHDKRPSQKRRHLNEQLKSRRIKADNIMKLYKEEKHIVNKKKFIEEYDEVMKFLKSNDITPILKENNIEINGNAIFYNDLLKICEALNISYETSSSSQPSFEKLIHLIFIDQTMNYQTTHLMHYDNKKTTLNGDYYLSLLYSIFNHSAAKGILSKDLISLYKQFYYIESLEQSELNMFKHSNFDKYTGLLNAYDHNDLHLLSRASNIIKTINASVLHLPSAFESICTSILISVKDHIRKTMGSIYLIEDICIAISFYALKAIYGLNDLPYLALLQNSKDSFEDDETISKALSLFEMHCLSDDMGDFYKRLPSLHEIIKSFSMELSKEATSQIMTQNQSLKQNLGKEYKKQYAKCNYEHLYKNIQNMFSAKNIKELENKFQKYCKKKNTAEPIIKPIVIKKSNRFQLKEIKKTSQNKGLNPFLREEIAYHQDNTSSLEAEYPFPCDTYIHHNRQANKFDSFHIPTTEVVFLYFFSKYFKLDYNSLKVLIKAVERSIDSLSK